MRRRLAALRASIKRRVQRVRGAFDRPTVLALVATASATAGVGQMFGTGAALLLFGLLCGTAAILTSPRR